MSDGMMLTPQEIADKLRLHINTIYRYLENGTIKGKLLAGHTWRVYQSDLEEFIDNGHNHADVVERNTRKS